MSAVTSTGTEAHATSLKYADLLMEWLRDHGYTHCFLVTGGAAMHLIDGARKTMTCIPVVHEVAAGIAAEHFNEVARADGRPERAFALVTAGPGLTNIVTAIAGAHLESRDLLVVGGQVKTADLADPGMRQRGIQEVDGVAMVSGVTVAARRLTAPLARASVLELVDAGTTPRRGAVFLEICLDVQGEVVDRRRLELDVVPAPRTAPLDRAVLERVGAMLAAAQRPVLLIGGGVSRGTAREASDRLAALQLPTMTSWTGADRVGSEHPSYMGRPNTWGQRSSNILLQQCDLLLAVGTRLGLQQTGFAHEQFAPLATVVHVDVDLSELTKGHPRTDLGWQHDPDEVLLELLELACSRSLSWRSWWAECREVRRLVPLTDAANSRRDGFLDPYEFALDLSERCRPSDVVLPCSSGGTMTVAYQAFQQKLGQIMITDHNLASMGYGLSGAVGAAAAAPDRRVVLMEGDGGFAQNMQELGTVVANQQDVKIFLLVNDGYASIRMTQRRYFGGSYVGCDAATGLGFPDWELLAAAFSLPVLHLADGFDTEGFDDLFEVEGPALFLVPIDPEQTYFPKISSQASATGAMSSSPLHLMDPPLPPELSRRVFTHLTTTSGEAHR